MRVAAGLDEGDALRDIARADRDISRLLERREELAPVFESIMQRLQGVSQDNCKKAVMKILDAHVKHKIQVFISYKSSQVDGAKALRKTLKDHAADKLEIFLAEESIRGGEDWQARIYDELTKAHWLIVLYPELSRDSTWVVFETGHFHGKYLPGDRLLCIHTPNEFPFEGVSRFQSFPANEESLLKFLTQMLKDPDPVVGMPPINASLSDDALRDSAKKLAQVLGPQSADWTTCGACMEVRVKARPGKHDKASLLAGQIEDATNMADVFGVRDRAAIGRTMNELLDKLPAIPHKDLWVDTLARAANNVLDGDAVIAKCASLVGHSGTLYRPHLIAVARQANSVGLRILFGDALTKRPAHVDEQLLAFQTALRLTFRTKWEFISPFSRALGPDDVARAEHVLNTLEAEAALDGVLDEDLVAGCYEADDAAKVKSLFAIWWKLRFEDASDPSAPSLAKAFASGDPNMLRKCVDALKPLNTEYAELAAKRVPYMVEKYWH